MTGKRILIVIDMQNDFVTGTLGSPEAKSIVPKVADLIRHGDYDRIVYTMDTHDENYGKTHEGRWLPVEHCQHTSNGW